MNLPIETVDLESNMEKYIYLLLSLSVFLTAMYIFWRRTDLRSLLLKMFFLGSILGPLSELWYFQDYWRPQSLFGRAVVSLEDVLFGAGVVGLGSTLYLVILRKKIGKVLYPTRDKTFLFFFLVGFFSLIYFTNYLHINSIFVSSFTMVAITFIMVFMRKDLLSPSLLSGLFLMLYISPIYIFLFDFISPHYAEKYWLITGGDILGIPLTEFLWYFSWGSFSGIAYQFLSGKAYKEIE